jgi:hypothetical protein
MATKKLGDFATPNHDYLCAHITQRVVDVENYEIKPHILTLVQQNHFGGSEDACMHLNTFTKTCDMMLIKDVNPNVVYMRLFPFHLEEKEK